MTRVKINIMLAFLIHVPSCKTSYKSERREYIKIKYNYTYTEIKNNQCLFPFRNRIETFQASNQSLNILLLRIHASSYKGFGISLDNIWVFELRNRYLQAFAISFTVFMSPDFPNGWLWGIEAKDKENPMNLVCLSKMRFVKVILWRLKPSLCL